jgi:uncharacterized membrane protein
MDGAQYIDDRLLLLILALLVSVLLFITSLLVAAGTSAAAKRQGRPSGLWTKASVIVAGTITLVWIALVVGANLGLDIGLW